jgi:protein TonB
MLRLTLADAAYSPSEGTQELLILPFGPDAVECSGFVPVAGYRPPKVSGSVKPPRKTRDVKPDYPPHLLTRGVEGIVVVESIITTKGCISEAKVLSGVEPSMDFAAMSAVLGWRFTATVIDGQAVPVTMTVTVNFTR